MLFATKLVRTQHIFDQIIPAIRIRGEKGCIDAEKRDLVSLGGLKRRAVERRERERGGGLAVDGEEECYGGDGVWNGRRRYREVGTK